MAIILYVLGSFLAGLAIGIYFTAWKALKEYGVNMFKDKEASK